ncbi:MAG: type IV pilus twitching motility protein PilT [Clostridiales bacterium]|jgi:twitching motility protein PilT|nr:type IV pilus twitching motility protein PilT [Clostridiales bacterium]MDR2749459.1 type IV pilus twitching motility protein PilT [Clostridiales bacterium]
MHVNDLLSAAVSGGASDIHITAGIGAIARIHGKLVKMSDRAFTGEDTLNFVRQVLTERELKAFAEIGEYDCSYSINGLSRFRVNVYRQRDTCSIAFRVIADRIPTIDELGLPPVLKDLTKKPRGLILVTGPTGSGKSTTLAAMIDHMNLTKNCHIITIEDPIEYLHKHKKCVVNQRQVGRDSISFSNALRSALRQDPDVILIGEMRDLETISIALTAAETGHLVLSTLHTIGAAKTVDRIIDVFLPSQQPQIRVQLASVIEAVVSQQILPRSDVAGRIAAFEIMIATTPIRTLIREGKTHQMQTVMQTAARDNMLTMDNSLLELYWRGAISLDELMERCVDSDIVSRQLGKLKSEVAH